MTKDVISLLNSPLFVGFDRVYDRLNEFQETVSKNIPSYPPYNIRKVDENKYVIELALAGFSKSDIEIEVKDDVLKITGSTKDDAENLLYRGIANRTFNRNFNLADTIEVKDASLMNGMLKVFLENIIPEHKKPKKININEDINSKEV
jgi:molecular chaperone IbpA